MQRCNVERIRPDFGRSSTSGGGGEFFQSPVLVVFVKHSADYVHDQFIIVVIMCEVVTKFTSYVK